MIEKFLVVFSLYLLVPSFSSKPFFLNKNLLIILYTKTTTEEYLVSKEITDGTFTTTQTSSWSISKVYTCPANTFIDYASRTFMGMFGKGETNQKTYSSLPPHWSLS